MSNACNLDPLDCSPAGSSVHGFSQPRVLEWVAISSSRGTSQPRDRTQVSWIGRLYHWATREALKKWIMVWKKKKVQFSRSVVSNSLRPHESQHTRSPWPSPTPRVHSDSHPSSQWCYPAISSSVIPFSSCPQSLPASESFPMSQLFSWGGQSTGVSALASFLPKKSQGWSPDVCTARGRLLSTLQFPGSIFPDIIRTSRILDKTSLSTERNRSREFQRDFSMRTFKRERSKILVSEKHNFSWRNALLNTGSQASLLPLRPQASSK